jgi:hypothetical protein
MTVFADYESIRKQQPENALVRWKSQSGNHIFIILFWFENKGNEKVYFWPSNYSLGLVSTIELENQESFTT